MSMRATFLGAGGAAPTMVRALSAPLANRNGERLLFDCREGIQRQMMRYGIGLGVGHLLVTHLHGDHILGIPGLIQTLGFNDRDDSLATRDPPESKSHPEQLAHAGGYQPGFHASVREVRLGNATYRADDYEVRAFSTEHWTALVGYAPAEDDRPGRFDREKAEKLGVSVGPAFGRLHAGEDVELEDRIVVRSEQVVGDPRPSRTVVYTGDTRPFNPIVEVAYDADLLAHDAVFTSEEAERAKQTMHLTAREAACVARDVDAWRFVLMHISTRYAADPSPLFEQAREVYDGEALVAEDGQKLEAPYADSDSGRTETGEQLGGRGMGTLFPRPRVPVDVPQNVFHAVDAFATAKHAGNQLAVFEGADALRPEQMAAFTNETNYSETAFIGSGSPDDGYDVRIFTPDGEIPSAGHSTLGTATVLRDHFGTGDEMMLNLGVGPISVEVRDDGSDSEQHRMTRDAPRFGAELNREMLVKVLLLDANDLDADWPIQVASTGLLVVMIPFRDRDAFAWGGVLTPAYRPLFDDVGVENLFLFRPDSRDDANDFAARIYAPDHGAAEDPAIRNADGCFAGYLVRHRYLGDDGIEVTVEQSYEMDRPSQFHLEAEDRGDEVAVRVGGCVEFISTGRLV